MLACHGPVAFLGGVAGAEATTGKPSQWRQAPAQASQILQPET